VTNVNRVTTVLLNPRGTLPLENGFMSQATAVISRAGTYGLYATLGGVLTLFAGFIYVFNYTSFF